MAIRPPPPTPFNTASALPVRGSWHSIRYDPGGKVAATDCSASPLR